MSKKAFISHTSLISQWPSWEDSLLKSAIAGVHEAGWSCEEMRAFPGSSTSSLQACVQKVRQCDAFLGILGFDWGHEPPEMANASFCKCEFEAAKGRIPTIFFIIDPKTHAFPAGVINQISESDRHKQDLFRKEILRDYHTKSFFDGHELRRVVAEALRELEKTPVTVGEIHPQIIASQKSPVSLTIGVPQFCDTSIIAACKGFGLFSRKGIDARIVVVKWHQQIDRLRMMRTSQTAIDIGFAVLSEIVETDSLSREYGSQNFFFLPTWEFIGMGFYCRNDLPTPDELGFRDRGMAAVREFFCHLQDKWIMLPQATVYEHALRMLAQSAEVGWSDLNIANTSLEEAASKAIGRPGVALIGVPQVSLIANDMVELGFKLALEQRHLGSIVTGLAANQSLRLKSDILQQVAEVWYEGVRQVELRPREAYKHAMIHMRKARVSEPKISFEQWASTLKVSQMPSNATAAKRKFLDPDSSVYWRDHWERLSESMALEYPDDIPKDQSAFIANSIISML